jgi:hypothetical protein
MYPSFFFKSTFILCYSDRHLSVLFQACVNVPSEQRQQLLEVISKEAILH